MTFRHQALCLLLLLLTLPLHADDRRKRQPQKPDTPPAALQADTLNGGPDSTLLPPEGRGLQAPGSMPHNLNTAPQQPAASWAGRLQRSLDSLCNTGIFETTQLGLHIHDLSTGQDLYTANHLQRMRPASCQKVVTAVAALDLLGGNHQLLTDLRLTGRVEGSVLQGDVYVVGRMDPLLSQGDVYRLAQALRDEGIDSIAGRLWADLSFKDDKPLGWGWCWDDKWGPLTALGVDTKDRFAEEFLSALSALGIGLAQPGMGQGVAPAQARLVMQTGHTIDQVLLQAVKQSDNIFAESLFYHIAAQGGQRGAGRKQAAQHIGRLLERLGLKASRYQVADGSGLSLYNYVTPQMLVRLLSYAWTNDRLRAHLLPSLPIAGSDGTLARRLRGTPAENNVYAKTGTVDGVSSLAGYATSPHGHVLVFSIINQGLIHTSTGRDFQDKVCRLLCSE